MNPLTNKELRNLLSQYPDDAYITLSIHNHLGSPECAVIKYDESKNEIVLGDESFENLLTELESIINRTIKIPAETIEDCIQDIYTSCGIY